MSTSHLKEEYREDSFDKEKQVEYNNAMIEYKSKPQTNPWLNALSKNSFDSTNDKPEVPENGFDVSDWDIETIEQYTEFLAKKNSPVKNTNNNSHFKYTYSNTLGNLQRTLTELNNDLEQLEGDGRYDKYNNNHLLPFRQTKYVSDYNIIDKKINDIEKQIKDEKDRLEKMSRKKGGKSRTKQHYRNKSNKRKSRKSKKSKRKSIKK